MRTSFVLSALVVTVLATAYGCTLPLQGLTPDGSGGAGTTSASSAGGASTTVTTATSTTASSVTATSGGSCSEDGECTGGAECATEKCMMGMCTLETATHDGTACGGPASGPCFNASTCANGACVPRPKPGSTVVDDGVSGNCTSLFCDGEGVSMPVAEPKDLPPDDDSTDCSEPICNGTSAETKDLANGDSCGQGFLCFNGQCQECIDNSDCGPDLNKCTSEVCNNGTCDHFPVANLTACLIGQCVGDTCCLSVKICGNNNLCCGAFEHCSGNQCKPGL